MEMIENVSELVVELEETVELASEGANISGFGCNVIKLIVGVHTMVAHA
jgi:hypothetical protein